MKKYINYDIKVFLLMSVLLSICLSSCTKMDGYSDPISTDKTKPGLVTNIKVNNFNGGAHITYTIPKSDNLLYILAKYKINDQTSLETKSSYYSDTVTVEGFAKSTEYDVTLYTVTRANVMSDPVTVKVHPLTPPYLLVKPTVSLSADFGGINIKATNAVKKPVGIILLSIDPTTNYPDVVDQNFTKITDVNYSLRGYSSTPKKFGIYVTDKYGNSSDTTIQTVTPLFETQLDKNKFFTYRLPSDGQIGYGWDLPYLWDGKIDGNGWHTNSGSGFPIVATFGLGLSAKLSRFVMVERFNEFAYGHGNPKNFSIWGSNVNQPQNAVLPRTAPVGTVVGDWINLSNYHFPDPPSGNPSTSPTATDEAFVRAGVNFNLPISSPKVKYIRVSVSDTWSGGDFAHIMEMTFFGDPN
ncbi:MAG: hypothetical protein JWN56_3029 [Sphingobacteriales bacterium]|nr:hypothetical protein [Sphingobacteriales bacterium]